MIAPDEWTPWLEVEGSPELELHVLAELLGGGQAFRWVEVGAGVWRGTWARFLAEVRTEGNRLQWRAPLELAAGVERALPEYLPDFQRLHHDVDLLPWRSDPILARAILAFPGLGILRQPLDETLLAFLCSSTKRIAQIRTCLELLAQRFGEMIFPGIHALPSWTRLAMVSEPELRACGLGFRARYVAAVAQELAENPDFLTSAVLLPYPACRDVLMRLPGVGDKVADCTLLFGADRPEAFPVDTWVLRSLRRRYGLTSWSLDQVAHFGRIHFGRSAGLAQQYLFALERLEARA